MSDSDQKQLAPNGMDFVPTIHNDTYALIDPLKQNLSGRSVFVTGASKGIGLSLVLSYVKAGVSQIAFGARSSLSALEEEIKSVASSTGRSAPKVLGFQLDVTDETSVANAAERVKQEFGSLDILVNMAGYLETWLPIIDSDPSEWWKTFNVNVKGPYLMARSFIPLLLAKPEGLKTVVNVTSGGAHVTFPSASAYQTSKLAIVRFTQFIESELKERGVLAFSIHPGGVPTDMAKRLPDWMQKVINDTPELGADTIMYVTAKKWDWINGRYLSVGWDMGEFEKKREEIEKKDLLKVRLAVQ